jgi:hypothetical protein
MSKHQNWTPQTENKPSEHDDNENFILKSWEHDQTGQLVTIFHEPSGNPEKPYYIEVQAFGTYGEHSNARAAKQNAGRILEDHPNGIGEMREGLPKDAEVTFTTGSPVKAGEYYDVAEGDFVSSSELDAPIYGIGRSTGGGEVAHSSDLRKVQAYGSTVMFVYSQGGELSHEELMQVVSGQDVYNTNRFDQVYMYSGRAIPALKTGTQEARSSRLRMMVEDYEQTLGYETNMTPEQAEDSGSFSIFT